MSANQWMLSELLSPFIQKEHIKPIVIKGLALDSRAVKAGDLFIALQGAVQNGWGYVNEAIARGAVAVVVSDDIPLVADCSIPVFVIEGLHQKVGLIAARFYREPSKHLSVIAVTGTSGKTSVCQLMAQALELVGKKTGIMGSLGVGFQGRLHYDSGLNTPDAISLQHHLKTFMESGAEAVVFEASSHGIDQGRINGTQIDTAIFTNLTQDHLDYHKTLQAYGAVKARLFEWPSLERVIINMDDPFGVLLSQQTSAKRVITTSAHVGHAANAHIQVTQVTYDLMGIHASVETPWGTLKVESGLLGPMNLSNLLVVIAYLGEMRQTVTEIESILPKLKSVPGRLERHGGYGKPVVFVDYAHKPDPLKQIVRLLNQLKIGRLFCVIGCGGDRDKGKRPLMAEAAAEADVTVITSDNPRTEDPVVIIEEMSAGLSLATKVYKTVDRAEAIQYAISEASKTDIVLIAGRGSEQYQIIGHEKIPFQDSEYVENALYSWHDEEEMK